MTTSSGCSRRWQAEAAEDRRLSDSDRASFERHLPTCAVCTCAVRELVELRRLATRTEAPANPPLDQRRARNELLRRANELTLGSTRARSWRFLAIAAAVGVLVVAVVVGLRPSVPGAPPATPPNDEPSYELVASPGAEWTAMERGPRLKLAMRRGRFELSVRRLAVGQRFVLVLPDGELEVQGTRFVVEVDGARTLGVRVAEGRVALRVRERAGSLLLLGAGESFAASPRSAPPAGSTPQPGEASSSAALVPRVPEKEAAPPPAPGSVAPPTSGAPHDAAKESASGVDFARAMSAFSSGNFGDAEKLFQTFAARHPADPRAEDATFLSAVASSRRGDHEHARLLARRYLSRYPSGLRRREAERLTK
jgi:ferric-dicitrate binding protein FerR (iron transport regulator)